MKVIMLTKIIAIFLVISALLVTLPNSVNAKRILPQIQAQKSAGKVVKTTSKGVNVSVKFRTDRNAITAVFTNLGIAKEVGYTLSYKTGDNIEQVAQSSIDLSAQEPVTRELLFGTCSTDNVCRYDTGIHDAKFLVTTTLKTGKKVIKTFNLKVKK